VYDPTTNTWTVKADCPSNAQNSSAGVIDGKLYVVGGYDSPFTQCRVYDPAQEGFLISPVSVDDEVYWDGTSFIKMLVGDTELIKGKNIITTKGDLKMDLSYLNGEGYLAGYIKYNS
jgi:hypothetical protein